MLDRVFIKDMVFFARHGLFEEEAKLGQRFEVDVDCRHAPSRDGAGQPPGIDYAKVYEAVKAIVEGERLDYIETLAERIADAVLARFRPVDEIVVTVRKPSAPIPGIYSTVGVEITRRRQAR